MFGGFVAPSDLRGSTQGRALQRSITGFRIADFGLAIGPLRRCGALELRPEGGIDAHQKGFAAHAGVTLTVNRRACRC